VKHAEKPFGMFPFLQIVFNATPGSKTAQKNFKKNTPIARPFCLSLRHTGKQTNDSA